MDTFILTQLKAIGHSKVKQGSGSNCKFKFKLLSERLQLIHKYLCQVWWCYMNISQDMPLETAQNPHKHPNNDTTSPKSIVKLSLQSTLGFSPFFSKGHQIWTHDLCYTTQLYNHLSWKDDSGSWSFLTVLLFPWSNEYMIE